MSHDALRAHAARLADRPLRELAAARAGRNSVSAAGWHLNLDRQRLDAATDDALIAYARDAGLKAAIDALFSGAKVNPSEGRPALHWALRASEPLKEATAEEVRASLASADEFADRVHSGDARAVNGAPYEAVLHIGIGGSDFGPRLIDDALIGPHGARTLRFCANLDPADLELALAGLDPARTLVIGVSKSFGTEETLYNLKRARSWLSGAIGDDWGAQMALVTANPERARAWADSDKPHLFQLPESVGGRFSIWSAASLACACAIGTPVLRAFRAGAESMDRHVRTAPLEENAAVRLALLDYWNASVLGYPMRALLAYARRLRLLPAYLQQLEMESNGKSVTPAGSPVTTATAPALWGGEGSIGQHSYHQWLHQGTQIVPAEFILALDPQAEPEGRRALSAHALAQAEVLANGRSLDEVMAEEPALDRQVAAQKVHAGGRPSSFITCPDLNAEALGALIALYEHRTYLAGCLWGLNPFDQWGVERGKTMAGRINPVLSGTGKASDPVTQRLANALRDGF